MRASANRVAVVALALLGSVALSDDPAPSAPTAVVSGLGEYPDALAVSRDGKTLVVADTGHALRVVDLTTGKTTRTMKGLTHDVESLAFAGGDCDVLISMGIGGDRTSKSVLRCWDWTTGGVRQDFDTSSSATAAERACNVAVSASTRDFAVSYSSPQKLRIHDAKRIRKPVEIQGDEAFIASCLAFSSDGSRLVALDGGGLGPTTVRIYVHADDKDKWARTVRFAEDKVVPPESKQWFMWSNVVLAPDAKLVIAHGWFGPDDEKPAARQYDILRCWDADTGALRWTQEVSPREHSVCDVLMSPRGDGLVIVRSDGIELRDPATGAVTQTLEKWPKRLRHAALSPDGRYVFATAVGGGVVKWDLGTGK